MRPEDADRLIGYLLRKMGQPNQMDRRRNRAVSQWSELAGCWWGEVVEVVSAVKVDVRVRQGSVRNPEQRSVGASVRRRSTRLQSR